MQIDRTQLLLQTWHSGHVLGLPMRSWAAEWSFFFFRAVSLSSVFFGLPFLALGTFFTFLAGFLQLLLLAFAVGLARGCFFVEALLAPDFAFSVVLLQGVMFSSSSCASWLSFVLPFPWPPVPSSICISWSSSSVLGVTISWSSSGVTSCMSCSSSSVFGVSRAGAGVSISWSSAGAWLSSSGWRGSIGTPNSAFLAAFKTSVSCNSCWAEGVVRSITPWTFSRAMLMAERVLCTTALGTKVAPSGAWGTERSASALIIYCASSPAKGASSSKISFISFAPTLAA